MGSRELTLEEEIERYREEVEEFVAAYEMIDSHVRGVLCRGLRIADKIEQRLETIPTNNEILFVCDRRVCNSCLSVTSECQHTPDIRHAKNFELNGSTFVEVVKGGNRNGRFV